MTVTVSQIVAGSLDTAVAGASMNALASGSYALGSAIDNRPTAGSVVSYDLADLTITLASAITPSTAIPQIVVWVLPAVDGTNYPSPPGGSAAAAPLSLAHAFQLVYNVSTTTIVCPNIPIPPYLFKIQIQNVTGVAFPSSNASTCQLQRKTTGSW